MRFVTVRELRSQSADVWRRLAKEPEMVITSNGKPVAILSAVLPEGLEESLAALPGPRLGCSRGHANAIRGRTETSNGPKRHRGRDCRGSQGS